VSAFRARTAHQLDGTIARLAEDAMTDSLTNLGNKRAFYQDFAREAANARRHGFKGINDTHGYQYGDAVLTRIAAVLQQLRKGDGAYRMSIHA
jgi:diguanylate cyclase (GGDEF)-like protein